MEIRRAENHIAVQIINKSRRYRAGSILCLLFFLYSSPKVTAHGGVALIDDVCVMSLGNLSAHFAGYQPQTSKSKEFCEDMPDVAESIFAIDFIHDVLQQMQVEFRIVRDINDVGLSATWADVQAIANLSQATVFHAPPRLYPSGSINVEYTFEERGTYIGVITAKDERNGKMYRAVFPFRIGARDFWDYLPYFVLVILVLEIFYWTSNGGLGKLKQRRMQRQSAHSRNAANDLRAI